MNDIASLDKALDGANALFLLFVLGVVIVTTNMNDIASLVKALDGAYAMFLLFVLGAFTVTANMNDIASYCNSQHERHREFR